MALLEGRNQFQVVRHSTRFSLILPDEGDPRSSPVLWLLPVRGGLHSDWVRHTRIERWAGKLGLVVVMPEGLKSDYVDMAYGMKWWQYLSSELPLYLRKLFGLDPDPSRQYAFGAEMGSLGALKLGLRQPERFSAVGAVDAPLDQFDRYDQQATPEQIDIYGEPPLSAEIWAANDPLALAKAVPSATLPVFSLETGAVCTDGLSRSILQNGGSVRWLPTSAKDWDGREEALRLFLNQCFGDML